MAFAQAAQGATPMEKVALVVTDDLMQRFSEMWGSRAPPSAERMLRWTLAAGRDPSWVKEWSSYLVPMDKRDKPVPPEVFDAWKHQIQKEMLRPEVNGESASDYTARLRRLHGFEFPSYRDEPYWRWENDTVRDLVGAGAAAIYSGMVGSGKTATCTVTCEKIARLKDEQIADGPRSTLAQMLGKKLGKGGRPDSPPDPDPSHLGLWYARDVRFISNYSIFEDTKRGIPSPLAARWERHARFTDIMLAAARAEREGYFIVFPVDESAFAVDKFMQGANRQKAIVGFTRIIRKINGIIPWVTQWGKDDFPKEVVKSANTTFQMADPYGGKARARATVTVSGSPLHERVITDIPLPASGFDTTDRPALIPDLDLKRALEFVALRREEAERAPGAVWGREERSGALEEAVMEQLRERPDERDRTQRDVDR